MCRNVGVNKVMTELNIALTSFKTIYYDYCLNNILDEELKDKFILITSNTQIKI